MHDSRLKVKRINIVEILFVKNIQESRRRIQYRTWCGL